MSEGYCSLEVGQRVVCIDAYWDDESLGEMRPVYDGVYTIREVFFDETWQEASVRLSEIVNSPRRYREGFGECAFLACRFRPVRTIDTTSQVAALKKLMQDATQRGKVSA